MGDNIGDVPPGFGFNPTYEELLVHFLQRKASLLPSHQDVDIHVLHPCPYDPLQLNGRALGEEYTWFYYSKRTENKLTENGFWYPTGVEEEVVSSASNKRIGIKKYFDFYLGDIPIDGGIYTDWKMEEYSLLDYSSSTNRSSKRNLHKKTVSTFP